MKCDFYKPGYIDQNGKIILYNERADEFQKNSNEVISRTVLLKNTKP